mmetsp:Transcript_14430/g.27741  ORF Transcript_14430/g.27741 Transcript_14430/m.27741 type:complete len:226 (-) Transcript_14430:187-864(-)
MPAILDQGFQIARPIVVDTGRIIASAQRRNQLGGSQRSQQRRRRRGRRGGCISRQTGTATSPQHFRFVSVHGIPLEGLNERGDLVNQHAEGVHVRLAVVRPAEGDFRTHVATRAGLGGEFVGSVVVVVVVAVVWEGHAPRPPGLVRQKSAQFFGKGRAVSQQPRPRHHGGMGIGGEKESFRRGGGGIGIGGNGLKAQTEPRVRGDGDGISSGHGEDGASVEFGGV